MKNISPLNRFKNLASEKDTRLLAGNFLSLIIVQGTNFLLPIFVLPFLVIRLGLEKYGLVAFTQSLAIYWIMFIDYGHNMSATREITLARDNREEVGFIVCRTLAAKAALTAIALLAMGLLILLVPEFRQEKALYLYSLVMVVGQSLTPVWFFQGMEQMRFVTTINLISKLLLAALIFLLIRQPADYLYVSLYYGLSSFVAGLGGIWFMFKHFDLKLKLPKDFSLWADLKAGFDLFLSHFSINICSNSNVFILGLVAPNTTIVGIYSIAEKITSIVRQLLQIFFQTTFPAVCKQVLAGHAAVIGFFRKFYLPFAGMVLCALVIAGVFAAPIVSIFSKDHREEIVLVFRILLLVPLAHLLNLPAFLTLLAYDRRNSILWIYGFAAFINIACNFILGSAFSLFGTAASTIITEMFVMAGLHTILQQRHPAERVLKGIVQRRS